jgi:6-pyruvoyltetrahydropterin/6-carboxytetrahydropterin synthase
MSRWVVHARASFTARHALTRYLGEPEESHSHLWQVAVRVGTDRLNDEGYAVDFHAVHQALATVVAPLDGSDLNAHPEIGAPTPSAERVAEVIAGWLAPVVQELGASLLSVSVWEGPENRVDLVLEEDRKSVG